MTWKSSSSSLVCGTLGFLSGTIFLGVVWIASSSSSSSSSSHPIDPPPFPASEAYFGLPASIPTIGSAFLSFLSELENVTGISLKQSSPPNGPGNMLRDIIANNQTGLNIEVYYGGRDPTFGLLYNMNGVFYSPESFHAWRASPFVKKMEADFYREQGVWTCVVADTGSQHGIFSLRDLASMNDIKDQKLRVPGFLGPVWSEMGLLPQRIGASGIKDALESGALDAAEFGNAPMNAWLWIQNITGIKFYYPALGEPNAAMVFHMPIALYDTLSPSKQRAMQAVCDASLARSLSHNMNEHFEAFQKYKDAKVEINRFNQDIIDAFQNAAASQLLKKARASDPESVYAKLYHNAVAFKAKYDDLKATEESYRRPYLSDSAIPPLPPLSPPPPPSPPSSPPAPSPPPSPPAPFTYLQVREGKFPLGTYTGPGTSTICTVFFTETSVDTVPSKDPADLPELEILFGGAEDLVEPVTDGDFDPATRTLTTVSYERVFSEDFLSFSIFDGAFVFYTKEGPPPPPFLPPAPPNPPTQPDAFSARRPVDTESTIHLTFDGGVYQVCKSDARVSLLWFNSQHTLVEMPTEQDYQNCNIAAGTVFPLLSAYSNAQGEEVAFGAILDATSLRADSGTSRYFVCSLGDHCVTDTRKFIVTCP